MISGLNSPPSPKDNSAEFLKLSTSMLSILIAQVWQTLFLFGFSSIFIRTFSLFEQSVQWGLLH
jgi:hypothetical protein